MALAYGDGFHSIVVGYFPLSCQGIVHAQLRQGGHAQCSQAYHSCEGLCFFEGRLRLFPLLQSVIRPPQGNEKVLEVDHWWKGPCKCDGILHKHERLFIGPRFQQSMYEAECTGDLRPDILALFGEREPLAATAQAVLHLPTM